ncbi:hypothetical protein Ancab_016717 [Ancistrocladus abbreviatus]
MRFRVDNWVPNLGPLKHFVVEDRPRVDETTTVVEFVDLLGHSAYAPFFGSLCIVSSSRVTTVFIGIWPRVTHVQFIKDNHNLRALGDYGHVRALWSTVLTPRAQPQFFCLGLTKWLYFNLSATFGQLVGM